MPTPRLALATCRDLPDWEVDDAPLHAALAARGAIVDQPAWDDPDYDWAAADLCLLRTTWDYQERLPAFLAWLGRADAATHVLNPPAVVRWNVHKGYLRDLAERGTPTLPTAWLPRGTDAGAVAIAGVLEATGAPPSDRAFLKPAVGATARGTLPFTLDADGLAVAGRHLAEWLPQEDMLLQPFCDTVEDEGEVSLLMIDGELSHAVRKIPVPGDYRVQDDFGASDEPWTAPADLRTIGAAAVAQAIDAIGLAPEDRPLLYARADFLRHETLGWCLTELELVEPSLFLRHGGAASERLAEAVLRRAGAAG